MSTKIFVDTDQMNLAANKLKEIEGYILPLGNSLEKICSSVRSYDGQLSRPAIEMGAGVNSMMKSLSSSCILPDMEYLLKIAKEFEKVDGQMVDSLNAYYDSVHGEPSLGSVVVNVIEGIISNPSDSLVNARDPKDPSKILCTLPNGTRVNIILGPDGKPITEKHIVNGIEYEFILIEVDGKQYLVLADAVFKPISGQDWPSDAADGTKTRNGDNDFGTSQFRNLVDIIPGFSYNYENYDYSHKLCGFFAAFQATGNSKLKDAFDKVWGNATTQAILKGDYYLDPSGLVNVLRDLGANPNAPVSISAEKGLTPEFVNQKLTSGSKMIVLVNLVEPLIADPNKQVGVGHYVNLERMWEDSTKTKWVEVYNPYHNQYEAYRWDTINEAMKYPGAPNKPGDGFYVEIPPAS